MTSASEAGASARSTPRAVRPAAHHTWMRVLAVVAALAGWWISRDLLRMSSGGQAGSALLAATCGEAGGDCLSVLSSAYARAGAQGPPWAALGAAYFGALALWMALIGLPARNNWLRFIPLLAVLTYGAVLSVSFLMLMYGVLQRWCVGCTLAHVCNGLIVLLTLAALGLRRVDPLTRAAPTLALLGAVAFASYFWLQLNISAVRLGLLGEYEQRYTKLIRDPNYALWRYGDQPALGLTLREGEHVAGEAGAPHLLIVYSDFQCGRCREAHRMVEEVRERHPGRLRVAYRHFPLHKDCNALVERSIHPAACAAARVAEAVGVVAGPEAAARMRNLLFARQEGLDRYSAAELAQDAGLDAAAVSAAAASEATLARIRADVATLSGKFAGQAAKAPVLVLNDRHLEFWNEHEVWKRLLETAAP